MHSRNPKFPFPLYQEEEDGDGKTSTYTTFEASHTLAFFILVAILLPFSLLLGPADGQAQICNGQGGNFTSNETYRKTLDSLLGLISPDKVRRPEV
ncbi:hypothetical protein MLD38_036900 [Melastoma candidum]|uniref:Uncharacterized protein n=1 Tax=Melastoma candidum TaxID=119954 RepID=A0ACB9LLN2_9MYRT|nr:hypothetical protein MLD38_036900 [Melastoma candidum]